MADLSTRYMGLELANPVIVGSSGLTDSVEGVKKCADAGAGAVVLKSIFEEQISGEVERIVHASGPSYWHSEGANYVRSYGRENAVEGYLELIREETHSCYLGMREIRHDWGYGCGDCPACDLRARGWERYRQVGTE